MDNLDRECRRAGQRFAAIAVLAVIFFGYVFYLGLKPKEYTWVEGYIFPEHPNMVCSPMIKEGETL